MDWPIGLEDVDFVRAIDFHLKKVPITPDAWKALYPPLRSRAFTVSAVQNLDVVTDAWRAIDKAVADGTTLEDFKKAVKGPLTDAWGGTVKRPAHRIETIYRTNVQGAYAAGRHAELTDPAVLEDQPYWQFDAIMDNRTSPVCKAAHGTVLPADDKWWATHNPPCHFNCRSTVIPMTGDEAKAAGVTETPTTEKAGDGFGEPPDLGDDAWVADKLANAPKDLATIVQAQLDVPSSGPRVPFRPNPPDTAPRTIEDAIAIAERNGVTVDRDRVRWTVAQHPIADAWSETVRLGTRRPDAPMRRADMTIDDKYLVAIHPRAMKSDDAICAVMAHGGHALALLDAYLARNPNATAADILKLMDPKVGALNAQAWAAADAITRRRHGEDG
jgi:SPP1 gp7 family putative phage head morphogenesis protein